MLIQAAKPIEKVRPYLALARALDESRLDESQLLQEAAELPPLTQELLDKLARQAAAAGPASPRFGWAVMAAAEAAARRRKNRVLAAQAAWYLGRAANEYGRPTLAAQALNRAEKLFNSLARSGWEDARSWLAAVTWQRHALCWAVPNRSLTIQALQTAVAALESSPDPLRGCLPHCRLTLAYAKVLNGDFDGLPALLRQCRDAFTDSGDHLHLARTLFVQAGYLRRTAPYSEAAAASREGMALARRLHAAADVGRFHCQMGFNAWLAEGDYQAAAQSFEAGIALFRRLDIPGWEAQCRDGLAQIYIMTGRFSEAAPLIESALALFTAEEAVGQVPPALLSAGWLEMLRGSYQQSLDHLSQAEDGYREQGNHTMVAVVKTAQGDTYLQLGRFQQALQKLEQAFTYLEARDLSSRLAECGLRLARLWTQLDNGQEAAVYLEKVREHAQKVEHVSALLAYYLRQAEHLTNDSKTEEAIATLTTALELAESQQNPSMEALCRRQLARAYSRRERWPEAAEQLAQAEAGIRRMGLEHEEAGCLLIWGDIHRRQGRPEAAEKAWKEAARLSQTIMPDIHWQAAAALAEMAAEYARQDGRPDGRLEEALACYRQMIQSLQLLRQGFWQPELSGSYLKRPSPALNQAVLLCAESGRHLEALAFIEESKAQTTARRIQAQALFREFDLVPHQARHLMGEIRWLQENMRLSNSGSGLPFRSAVYEKRHRQLREKIDAYTGQLNRLQRERLDPGHLPAGSGFQIDHFRRQAAAHLGSHWAALDYFQAGSQLICLLATPTEVTAYPLHLPDDFAETIELLRRPALLKEQTLKAIMAYAGQYLFPAPVQERLGEFGTLIIAPHRDLHRLPWAALHSGGDDYRPLVEAVTPVVVPSLQTLSLLWQRPEWKGERRNGLLLAVSDFQGRHEALPSISQEVRLLAPFLGENGRLLLDQQATAAALAAEMTGSGRFDFWHIASHAFHDDHSGHLSGLALYDQDFWLDEFWQLAPLPGLVTFSACGSGKSRLFEGDDHIGLTTTCLTAGAGHVVGSIWDVPDEGMAGMMADFYGRLLHPAEGTAVLVSEALAQAQRRAWKSGLRWLVWAGFRCTGRP